MSVALQKDYSSAATAAMTSTEEIRQRFPALARTHNGYSIAYFDGPGGTQVPRAVVEAMNDYLYHHNANTHWAYPTSAETDAIIDKRSGSDHRQDADATSHCPSIHVRCPSRGFTRAAGYCSSPP